MTNLNAIRHSVVAVTLPESDYYTLFSAYKNDGERDPDAVEVLQECRFLDHAEELRLNLLHTLAIMPAEYLIIRRGK
jgi:hypothetical protein